MHTSSRIYHKLSLLQFFRWRNWEYPLFRKRVEFSFVVLFELVHVFGKVPRLASRTSLLSFSLFMGPVLKFHSVRTSLMKNLDTCFCQRWSFLFWILARRGVVWVSRTLWIGSKTFCIDFLRDFQPWEPSASWSCDTQPSCDTFLTIATALVCSISLCFEK